MSPPVPMWKPSTTPARSAAAHSGSHRSSAYSSPGRVWLGRNTAWKPSPAARSSSATASPMSAVDTHAVGMTRLFLLRISACAQSFQARTVSLASSRSVILTVQKPMDGNASWPQTPSASRSFSRMSRSRAPGGRIASMKSFS